MRRLLLTLFGALSALAVLPAAALAHGVQGRAETPIPISAFFWAAGIVLIVSFVGLALGWSRPLLTRYPWRRAPRWLERAVLSPVSTWIGRVLVLAGFLLVWAAAAFGSTKLGSNLSPLVVFVVWWVGLVPLTALFGNVWRELNPWATIATLLRFPRRREREYPRQLGWWPAAAFLLLFAWLELVYPTPAEPRLIAALIGGYTAINLAAMWRWGIDAWLDHGEVFTVYTHVLAHLSPVEVRHTAENERVLGFRPPLLAVTHIATRPAMVAFIGVLIATVTFDGLSGSDVWTTRDVAASERLINLGVPDFPAGILVATMGLIGALLAIVALFEGASWASAKAANWPNVTSVGRMAVAFAHSLIPIALAYFVAHYFTLFVFQSQDLIRLASDPFGNGSDWFGTADHAINFQLVSANVIWAVQVGAIVIGHVVGLMLAHDRALQLASRHGEAIRSQWPMLFLMVLLTVSGLWSLSEGMAGV
jgi:hypothetical protein